MIAIDISKHDFICCEDLYKFLKNYGFDVNKRQVERLDEVINYNLNGKITQKQLQWALEGFENKEK